MFICLNRIRRPTDDRTGHDRESVSWLPAPSQPLFDLLATDNALSHEMGQTVTLPAPFSFPLVFRFGLCNSLPLDVARVIGSTTGQWLSMANYVAFSAVGSLGQLRELTLCLGATPDPPLFAPS